ncbi:MAG: type IV pilus secretin PilQ [Deltaproteobacteria bacterium]|nr:type IV pilus secretin PilQ [Deltaproteobacteria bacterium]
MLTSPPAMKTATQADTPVVPENAAVQPSSETLAPVSSVKEANNAEGQSEIIPAPTDETQAPERKEPDAGISPAASVEESEAPRAHARKPEQKVSYSGKKISLDFKNADIHDVFRIVAEVSGLNIVATDDVKGRVTLHLIEIPWDQALAIVLQVNGLEKSRTGSVITVSTAQRRETERSARLLAQTTQQKLTPLATEYIKVNYVKATGIAALITRETQQKRSGAAAGTAPPPVTPAPEAVVTGKSQRVALMSPRGTIAADPTTNVLIVRDLPENIAAVRELIQNIDVQTPQVVIESYIVTTSDTVLRDLGVQWGYQYKASPETGNPTGVNFPGRIGVGGAGLGLGSEDLPFVVDFPAGASPGSGAALDLLLGSLSGSQSLNLRLSALEREGKLQVVSRPRVVTLNNKAAEIKARREVRVPIVAGSLSVSGGGRATGGGNAFQEFDVGITLKVTPQISSDGFVLLDVDAESSELASDSSAPPFPGSTTAIPVIRDVLKRTASSNVLIRNGDTFVLGGILQDNLSRQERGVPYLRDTPVLGWLFKNRNKSLNKDELLVFITPRLISGFSPGALPTAKQLWEERPRGGTEHSVH